MINPNEYNWHYVQQGEISTEPSETIAGLDYSVQQLLNLYAVNQLPPNLSHAIVADDRATAMGALIEDKPVLDYATTKDKLAVAEYLSKNQDNSLKMSRVDTPKVENDSSVPSENTE